MSQIFSARGEYHCDKVCNQWTPTCSHKVHHSLQPDPVYIIHMLHQVNWPVWLACSNSQSTRRSQYMSLWWNLLPTLFPTSSPAMTETWLLSGTSLSGQGNLCIRDAILYLHFLYLLRVFLRGGQEGAFAPPLEDFVPPTWAFPIKFYSTASLSVPNIN